MSGRHLWRMRYQACRFLSPQHSVPGIFQNVQFKPLSSGAADQLQCWPYAGYSALQWQCRYYCCIPRTLKQPARLLQEPLASAAVSSRRLQVMSSSLALCVTFPAFAAMSDLIQQFAAIQSQSQLGLATQAFGLNSGSNSHPFLEGSTSDCKFRTEGFRHHKFIKTNFLVC